MGGNYWQETPPPARPRSLCEARLLHISPGPSANCSERERLAPGPKSNVFIQSSRTAVPLRVETNQFGDKANGNSSANLNAKCQDPNRMTPSPRHWRRIEDSNRNRGSWPSVSTPLWQNESFPNSTHQIMPYPTPITQDAKVPSMAALLNTTVPQSIVVRPYSSHHAPTRNSLRHSRMVNLSRCGAVPRKFLPPVIHRYSLGTTLLIFQTFLGLGLLAIAACLLTWAPYLNTRDVPHYSGMALVLAGAFGLFLLCCFRQKYPGMRGVWCAFPVKVQYLVLSVFLAVGAAATCLCACTFASIHVHFLTTLRCTDKMLEHNTTLVHACVCETEDPTSLRQYTYPLLTCGEVKYNLFALLVSSSVMDGLAVVISIWYVFLVWSSRYSYTYAGIKSNEQKTAALAGLASL